MRRSALIARPPQSLRPPTYLRNKNCPKPQPGRQSQTSASLEVNRGILERPALVFGRVDQYELLRPDVCPNCGSLEFSQQPVAIQVQQVAQLVERPIEVVEYQRQSCQCVHCGQVHIAAWPQSIVPGQDLGLSLQGLHARVGQLCSCVIREAARTTAGTWRYRHRGRHPPSYESAYV